MNFPGKAYGAIVVAVYTSNVLHLVAKYRAQLLEPEKKSAKGEGFDVLKSGGTLGNLLCFCLSKIWFRCPRVYDRFPIGRKIYIVIEDHQD